MKTQDIKKMSHVLRLPRMTDMYQKAVRRYKDAEETKKYEKEAIENLSKIINKSNEPQFFDTFVQHLDEMYVNPKPEKDLENNNPIKVQLSDHEILTPDTIQDLSPSAIETELRKFM